MGTTANLKLPWPELNDAVDGPGSFEGLAVAVESYFFNRSLPAGVTRLPTYHWGAGTAFPPGAAVGDTFTHTSLGPSLMRWNGAAWRQTEPCELVNTSARDVISINQAPLLHEGFTVKIGSDVWSWDTGTGTWFPDGVTAVAGKMWKTGNFTPVPSAAAVITIGSSRVSGGVTFDATRNALVLPMDGIWRLSLSSYISGGAATGSADTFLNRTRSGVADISIVRIRDNKTDTADSFGGDSTEVPLKAADALYMSIALQSGSGINYFGSTEAIGVRCSARWLGPLNGVTPV